MGAGDAAKWGHRASHARQEQQNWQSHPPRLRQPRSRWVRAPRIIGVSSVSLYIANAMQCLMES